jgi:pimeloyl-ACP methyl ester carboxylesterase
MRKAATALGALVLVTSPSAEDIQRGYASVNGVKLYYEIRGSGPPVVLLHGGIQTIETSFAKVLPELARKFRVVAVEQVGHGHTADSGQSFSYNKMAEDTAALLGKIGLGRADLIGWSDGGIVALLVAAKYPEHVRRAVVSGVSTRLEGIQPEFLKWLRETTPDGLVKILPKELRDAYERTSPDGSAHWPVLVAKARDLWLSRSVEKTQLAAIDAAVLLIAGDQDYWATAEHSVDIFRSLRRSQLWIVPGTGHDTFNARPAWLLAVITDFLEAPDKPAK